MDPTIHHLLDSFTKGASKEQLQSADWDRFFDVVVYAHRRRVVVTGQQIRLYLIECGFSGLAASQLGSTFELFCRLLTRYDGPTTA